MSKWEKVRIKDIGQVITGNTPSTNTSEYYESNDILFFKPNDLSDSIVQILKKSTNYVSEKARSSIRIVPQGSILVSCIGIIGKVGVVQKESAFNQQINAIIPDLLKVESKYLAYVFLNIKNILRDKANSAIVPIINKSQFSDVIIPLPPLEVQKQIAQNLDIVSELLALRKKQLEELDGLIKSVFYDMFGDPVTNDKEWEVNYLSNVTSKIGSGATPRGGKESYIDEGISLIRSMNVYDGDFKYKDLAFLNDEQAHQLRNVIVKENDVLINITGASVARTCIVPKDILPARVNQHVSIIRCIVSKLIPEYLVYLFIFETFKRNLLAIGSSGGATREAITKQQLEQLSIPVPPLSLQNQFASIVTKIEEQKSLVKQSIEETQTLFDSLMSQYFDD